MPTTYIGSRPILKGRSTADQKHPIRNKVGVYSNYAIYDTSHVLDGFPDRSVQPGEGKFPSDYFTSYLFTGKFHIAPLKDPGLGARLNGFRYNPWLFRGLESARVFPSNFGHAPDRVNAYALYNNYAFDGVGVQPLDDPGHAKRYTSTFNSFGSFDPWIWKGVGDNQPLDDPGQVLTDTYDNDYGHNRVHEWRGVTSAKAL